MLKKIKISPETARAIEALKYMNYSFQDFMEARIRLEEMPNEISIMATRIFYESIFAQENFERRLMVLSTEQLAIALIVGYEV